SPAEFALDLRYGRKMGEHFAMSLTARYINSALGAGFYNGLEMAPASAFAMDVSVYSERELFRSRQFGKRFAWGINLSNVGTKISYSNSKESFLPMNLRLGTGYALYNDPNNRLTLLLDVNKLMVPTSQTYRLDENGQPTTEIALGKDPNRSVTDALFTSLFDAPGGFGEELSGATMAERFAFCYIRQLSHRARDFEEATDKGNRQHLSSGFGIRVRDLPLDMSYSKPMARRYTA